MTGGSNRD